MTILPQQTDGGNYAAERLVGQQVIDPTLAASTDANGWVYHFRRRAEEAEKMVEVQTAARNAAEANYESLATAFSGEQQRAQEVREDYEYTLEAITELNQGCSWLAETLADVEEDASKYRALFGMCDSNFRSMQDERDLALQKLGELQSSLDTALAELATLKAERKQEDETIGPVLRRALNQRDHYARERDDLVKSVLLWSAEAVRLQKEVIAIADGAAQARTVILTLADGLHYNQTLEAWVLKTPLGDLLRELADELRNAS